MRVHLDFTKFLKMRKNTNWTVRPNPEDRRIKQAMMKLQGMADHSYSPRNFSVITQDSAL